MENLIDKARQHVSHLLSHQLGNYFLFHNMLLTERTVHHVLQILNADEESQPFREELTLAAWFLFAGFSSGYIEHVDESKRIAEKFLISIGYDTKKTVRVVKLIHAAWNFDVPKKEEDAIIMDGRTSHYAYEDFEELLVLQRQEQKNLNMDPPSLNDWKWQHIELLRFGHQFFTSYAKQNWQGQKEKNVTALIKLSEKVKKTRKKEELKIYLKNQSPERATQSLYRTQLRNHLKLSDIADTKANILLSVNAIIISLLLANLIPKLGTPNNSYLIYPTAIFVFFSIASMVMSVLATRPKIDNKQFVDGSIPEEDMNYLFFGNFHTMTPQNFKQKMREINQNKDRIYDSLSLDLYFLGKVLKAKYQLLRLTYTIFIIGMVLSVVAFALALKYFGMEQDLIEAVTPGLK